MTTTDTIACLDRHDNACEGEVEYHMQPYPSTRSFPRCAHHWRLRCEVQEGIDRRYAPNSDCPPEGFDPTIAGERWDDDY
jgi:hypothetical protein